MKTNVLVTLLIIFLAVAAFNLLQTIQANQIQQQQLIESTQALVISNMERIKRLEKGQKESVAQAEYWQAQFERLNLENQNQ